MQDRNISEQAVLADRANKSPYFCNVINFTKRVYQTQLLFLCCSVAAYSASWSLGGAICNTVNEHADF
jgi:hypothetical protein